MREPTENSFLLYHHMGLGDHINLNGLVRKKYSQETFDHFYLMTKERYTDQVSHMYRDLDNFTCIKAPDDDWQSSTRFAAHEIYENFPGKKFKLFVGSENGGFIIPEYVYQPHEFYFYTALNYTLDDRYNYFHLNRDYNREREVYDRVIGSSSKAYIFVADDPVRNYEIELDRVYGRHSYDIVRSCELLDYTLFDLLMVIEKSVAFHGMWSSVDKLCDLLNPGFIDNFYIHESYLNDNLGKIGLYSQAIKNQDAYRNFCMTRGIILL